MAKAARSGASSTSGNDAGRSRRGGGRGPKGPGPGANRPVPPNTHKTGLRRFLRESWGELRKVQWPTREQVAQGTLVVGVVTIAFALYISAVDVVGLKLVEQLYKLLG